MRSEIKFIILTIRNIDSIVAFSLLKLLRLKIKSLIRSISLFNFRLRKLNSLIVTRVTYLNETSRTHIGIINTNIGKDDDRIILFFVFVFNIF